MTRLTCLLALTIVVVATPASAQRTPNQSAAAPTGRTTGGGGNAAAGGNFQQGQLSTDAGSAEGVSRDFGDGLVGRGDTTGRFVGNQNAENAAATRRPPNFQGIDRQRATPPSPPVSPVRPTLRLNLQSISTPRYTAPVRGLRDPQATNRAIDQISPSLSYHVRGDVAVLHGKADTARRRSVAAALLRLEPGVRRVDDRAGVRMTVPPLP